MFANLLDFFKKPDPCASLTSRMPRFRSGGAYGKYFVLRRRYRGTDLQLDGGLLGVDFGFDEISKLQIPGATKKTLGSLLRQKKQQTTLDDFGKSEPDLVFCFLEACSFRFTFCQSFVDFFFGM